MAKTKTTNTADKKPIEHASSIRNIFLSEKKKNIYRPGRFLSSRRGSDFEEEGSR